MISKAVAGPSSTLLPPPSVASIFFSTMSLSLDEVSNLLAEPLAEAAWIGFSSVEEGLVNSPEFVALLHSEMLNKGDEVFLTMGRSVVEPDSKGGGLSWTVVACPAGRLVLRLNPVLLDTLLTPLDGLTDWRVLLTPAVDGLVEDWFD